MYLLISYNRITRRCGLSRYLVWLALFICIFAWKVIFYVGIITLTVMIIILSKNYNVMLNRPCILKKQTAHRSNVYPTVITAYYDIGHFAKGSSSNIRSPQHYIDWMNAFANMNNNVIFYSDSINNTKAFGKLRKGKEQMTKIVYLPRENLTSFRLKKKIDDIIVRPGYPKYYPNTVNSEYIIVQHTKYVVVKHAIENKLFDADFYCWLDIGIYRDIAKENKPFHLEVPVDFNSSKIAFNELITYKYRKMNSFDIFLKNMVRVAGNSFLGSRDVLLKFCDQYLYSVSYFITQNLTNTDQQVLFAMYMDKKLSKSISVELQTYTPDCRIVYYPDRWFYLGYYMLHYD